MWTDLGALYTTTTTALCELTLVLFTPPPQPCVNWPWCSLHHHSHVWTDLVLSALYTTTGTALWELTLVLFTPPPQSCVNWPWCSLHYHHHLVWTDLCALYTITTALCELTFVLFTPSPQPCVNWPWCSLNHHHSLVSTDLVLCADLVSCPCSIFTVQRSLLGSLARAHAEVCCWLLTIHSMGNHVHCQSLSTLSLQSTY